MKRLALLLCLVTAFARAAQMDAGVAARAIDVLLQAKWQANQIQPNPPASDEVFVRRIYLDVAGRIPTAREAAAFLADADANKRATLIDRLLASEGASQHLFNYWADLLRVLSKGTYNGLAGQNTGTAYADYVMRSIRANKPLDQFVRELVTAQGNAWENGAVGYYQRDRGMPLENMALTSRVFLGTRIECAQCHNHPFDRWKQKQFYELAAYTYGVQTAFGTYSPSFNAMLTLNRQRRERAGGKVEDETFLRQAFGEMNIPLRHTSVIFRKETLRLPHDYQYGDARPKDAIQPAVLFGAPPAVSPGTSSLEAFGTWLTSPDNPRFTKVIANRLWKKVFGLGLVEPVDDWKDSTAPANPELLAHLEKLLVSLQYDTRAFLRVLYNTGAYQREATRAEIAAGAAYHFTGPLLRRMSAEQLWDSLVTLINPTPDLPNIEAREATARLLANARKLGDALENMPPGELLARADATSAIFREHAGTMKELQRQMAEARARDDKEKVKALGRELGGLRKSETQAANDQVFIPAVSTLAAKVSAQPVATPTGITSYEQIPVPGYEPRPLTAARASQENAFVEEMNRYGIPEAQRESYLRHRRAAQTTWTRAAELPSPAPPGHALREFGQSDRETVENANTDASVPQVLVLMNSRILPQILAPFSQLKLTMGREKTLDGKIEAAYLTVFSRPPTAGEKIAWQKAQAQGMTNIDSLLFALLNTQQFLFIQ